MDNTNDNKHIYTNRFIYAISTLAIISLIFVSVEIVWKIVPSIYYTIQFAWRLNGFVYLFVNILFAVLLDRYAKEFFGVSVIAVGTLPMFSQALVEKRIIRENLLKEPKKI